MAQHGLSKRLQIITLCPLIIGILVCTVLIIAILFDNYKTWVSDTKDYIKSSEFDSLRTLSSSASDLLNSKIKQMSLELNSLNLLFSKNIPLATSSSSLINTVNYYKVSDYSSENKDSKTVWMSDNKDFTDFDKYSQNLKNNTAVVDVFMKILMDERPEVTQIGMIIDKSSGLPKEQILDYRFPIIDLEETPNDSKSCGKSGEYSSTCTKAYQLLKEKNHEIVVYTEDDSIKVLRNSEFGAFIYYLPVNYFDYLFRNVDDYMFFLSDSSGGRTIRVFQMDDAENEFEYDPKVIKLSSNMFEDEKLQKETEKELESVKSDLSEDVSSTFTIEGYYSTFYSSISYLNVKLTGYNDSTSLSESGSMIAGAYVNKGLVFKEWNTVLDDIIDTIIIQMVIFLVLLGITCLLAWLIAVEITERVTHPIYLFEKFLRGESVSIDFERKYNKEVNKILNYLRLLKTLENMIEPRFLLHPNLEKREQNLKETLELFEVIMNKRGKSIIYNLLGNIEYNRGNSSEAVEWFREAVKQIEELILEVDEQDKGEKELTDEEKEKLNFNEEKRDINWENEKVCLKDMLIDKKQQLCMGLITESSKSTLDINESRGKLKEINKYQKEILQYYSDNKIQYFRLIKLLIDMARVYKELKYYHSGTELLDFVQDELKKLENEGAGQIDIDTARLSKLGVIGSNEDTTNSNLHFSVKGYSFERDILMQHANYQRAKIFKESDKPYEAGLAYTAVIEKGDYYDPVLRRRSVKKLASLLDKYGATSENIMKLKSELSEPRTAVLFVLAFDVSISPYSEIIQSFITEKLSKCKVGATTLNPRPELKMKTWLRDDPGRDFEEFIEKSKETGKQQSTLDSVITASDYFEDSSSDNKVMIIITNEFTTNGFAELDDLSYLVQKDLKVNLVIHESSKNSKVSSTFEKIGARIDSFSIDSLERVLNSIYKSIRN